MFSLFGFSIQEFFICYFYCQKTAFVCEFQHIPLQKIIFLRFCTHAPCELPNTNKNKNMKHGNPYLHPKMLFLASKPLMSLSSAMEKTFSLILNVMISQTVKNECVIFDGDVDIEVSYKIF
jgi:hypothetical protein